MEIWDLYDENRNRTGETAVRGEAMPEGGYHLSVYVWIRNDEGKYLMTQRSEEKTHPLKWECVGGCALKGEDSLSAALREVAEETGIVLRGESGELLDTKVRGCELLDVWLFANNGDADLSRALTKEVAQARWMTKEEIEVLEWEGNTAPWHRELRFF